MPSLAQRYGQGLLSGLEIQERQRRLRQADLLDEYRKEQIADIRWEREKEKKSLLAQIKEEEEQAKRQKEGEEIRTGVAHLGMQPGGSYTVGKLLEEAPETVREPLYSALDLVPGLTSGQQLQRTRVEEKVEGAPGVRPWYETYLGGEEMGEAAKVAGGLKPKARAETEKTISAEAQMLDRYAGISPEELEQIAPGMIVKYRRRGYEWNAEQGAWIKPKVAAVNLFGAFGIGGEGTEIPGSDEKKILEQQNRILKLLEQLEK